MRKSHFACLLLGVVAGVALGFGMVIAQLKYGRTPVAAVDPCDDGVCQSTVKEPTPLGEELTDEDDKKPNTPTDPQPVLDEQGIVLGAPIQVPFGSVEVTMVHRLGGDVVAPVPQESNPLDGGAEEVERRMFNHLVRHMQTGGCEASEATAELLPMPSEQSAATVIQDAPYPFGPVEPETHYVPAWKNQAKPQAAGKKPRLPYFGQYNAAIDCENHMTLPAEVHEMLANPRPRVLYIMPGNEPCLCLCTQSILRQVFDSGLMVGGSRDYTDSERRIFLSKVRRIEVGADGSMTLPADLLEQAGLTGMPVVIIGVDDHLEIWDRCRWNEYSGVATEASFNDLAEIFSNVVAHVIGNLPLPLDVSLSWDETNCRMKELLNASHIDEIDYESDEFWQTEEEPAPLTPEKVHGGIQ